MLPPPPPICFQCTFPRRWQSLHVHPASFWIYCCSSASDENQRTCPLACIWSTCLCTHPQYNIQSDKLSVETKCMLCFSGSSVPWLKSLAFLMNYGLNSWCFIILMTWDESVHVLVKLCPKFGLTPLTSGADSWSLHCKKTAPQKVWLKSASESLVLLQTWQISWQCDTKIIKIILKN